MPSFTQRKQLCSRRRSALGTVQATITLPDSKTVQPGATLPIHVEIRRACRRHCAIDEIRIRLYEVTSRSTTTSKRRRGMPMEEESSTLMTRTTQTNQQHKSKSGIIEIPHYLLEIPTDARCDSTKPRRIRHVLEVKLTTRGMGVENMMFTVPFVIGGCQQYKVMPDNHECHSHDSVRSTSGNNKKKNTRNSSSTGPSSLSVIRSRLWPWRTSKATTSCPSDYSSSCNSETTSETASVDSDYDETDSTLITQRSAASNIAFQHQ